MSVSGNPPIKFKATHLVSALCLYLFILLSFLKNEMDIFLLFAFISYSIIKQISIFKQGKGLYYYLFTMQDTLHDKMWQVKHKILFHFLKSEAACRMAAT